MKTQDLLTGRIEADRVQLPKAPDMAQPVTVQIDDVSRTFVMVRAEKNYDGTWDLVLEPLPK
jgi:hypothetical protein